MSITTLDARTALVVIDLQQGIVALPTAHPAEEVVARSAGWPPRSASAGCPSSW